LSALEQEVINFLAAQAFPLSWADLRTQISPLISTVMLLGSLKSLKARSLLERTAADFSLPPFLRDYVRSSKVFPLDHRSEALAP
jgi:hypothetical protein